MMNARDRNLLRARAAARRARAAGLAPLDPRHGTPAGYTRYGCHCPKCQAAVGRKRKDPTQ